MLGFAILGLLGIGLIVGVNSDYDDEAFADDEFFADQDTREEGTNGTDLFDMVGGDDTVFAAGGDDLVLAGGDDLVLAGDGDDVLHGGSGNDLIFGNAGEDTINGYAGDDQIIGADVIDADSLFEAMENAITGGVPPTEDDVDTFFDLNADPGEADVLNGSAGSDDILAGSNDIVDTGEGTDTVNVGMWVNPDEPVEIVDFDPFEDDIIYSYEGETEPDVFFGEDENGTATLVADGRTVAFFENAEFSDLNSNTSIILERFA